MKLKPTVKKPFTAVVVNNNATQRELLSDLLKTAGFTVSSFTYADEALHTMMAGIPPSLIITDLSLPRIDGFQFCRLLRSPEFKAFNQIPVIVVSDIFVGDEAEHIISDLDVDAFMTFPVEESRFIEKVRSLLKEESKEKMAVLLVEDDELLTDIMKKAFESQGYRVDTVISSLAEKVVRGKDYKVAVMDYDFCSEKYDALLKDFLFCHPSSICLMIYTDLSPAGILSMMRQGAAACLKKPFEPDCIIRLCAGVRRERAILGEHGKLKCELKELKENEERWHSALECAGDGVWDWNAQTNRVFFSRQWKSMLGYEENEIGDTVDEWDKRIHPDDREIAYGSINRHFSGESPVYMSEHRLRCKDGSYRWILDRGRIVSRTSDGKPLRVIGTHTDISEQKKMEDSLRQYAHIVSSSHDMMALVNQDFVYLAANMAFSKNFGRTPEEIVGKTVKEILGEETFKTITIPQSRLCMNGETVRYEIWLDLPLTGPRYLEISYYPYIERNKVQGFAVYVRDLTDKKQAEELIKYTERRYQNFVSNASEGIYRIDFTVPISIDLPDEELIENLSRHSVVGEVNNALAKMYGLKPEDMIGRPATDFAPDYGKRAILAVRATENRVLNIETIDIDKYGYPLYLSENFTGIIEDGILFHIWGMQQDITKRKEAEIKLQESEVRFRSILEASPMGMHLYELQPENRLVFMGANPAADNILGVEHSGFIGMTIEEAFPPLAATEVPERYREAAVRGIIWQSEHIDYDYTNIRGVYQITAFQICTGKMAVFFTDITDRKKAEAEKEKLQEQLMQARKMESVGRLAGGVAHDFNNMLGVILGYVGLCLEDVNSPGILYDSLKGIEKAAHRSADLTRQLLAFARKQTIAPKVLNLNDTLSGMLRMLQRLIGENILLTWIPGTALWPVRVDPSQVDQILANLCVNARDSMPEGGKIIIETENTTVDDTYCVSHTDSIPGSYVLLSVSDDGCGMDTEVLSRLFEPFFTTKEFGKGTGLGLATVYGIVRQNKGFINVYSEPGKGTSFKIYLPRFTGKDGETPQVNIEKTIPGGHETLLLVEDEPDMLNMVKAMLEKLGYKVLAAGTPGEALCMADKHRENIHLVITDVIMPEMNGRELLRRLLTICPDMKYLFMSGYTANVIAHHGVLEKGVHFIQKPFSNKELALKVREGLENI